MFDQPKIVEGTDARVGADKGCQVITLNESGMPRATAHYHPFRLWLFIHKYLILFDHKHVVTERKTV